MYFRKNIELILNKNTYTLLFSYYSLLFTIHSFIRHPSPDETRFLPTSQHGFDNKIHRQLLCRTRFCPGKSFCIPSVFLYQGDTRKLGLVLPPEDTESDSHKTSGTRIREPTACAKLVPGT